MKKLHKNQLGFGAVEALIIIVLIGLAGGGGWYVWHTKHNKSAAHHTTTTVKTTNTPKTSTKASKTPTPVPADNSGYLVIKEWGIKMKLEDASKLTYTMHGTPNGSPNADALTSYATLRLNDSVATSDACREVGMSVSQTTAATNATKVGNYYYGLDGALNQCGDSNADTLKAKIVDHELVLSAIVAE
jgi:hypothetical protein